MRINFLFDIYILLRAGKLLSVPVLEIVRVNRGLFYVIQERRLEFFVRIQNIFEIRLGTNSTKSPYLMIH